MGSPVGINHVHQTVADTCNRFPTEHLITLDEFFKVFLCKHLYTMGIVNKGEWGDSL